MTRIKKMEGSEERRVLIGMITSDSVLNVIAAQWSKESNGSGLFKSKHSNLIASWCIKHHEKYSMAPKAAIQSIFDSWSDKQRKLGDDKTPEMVGDLLESMQQENRNLGKLNAEYITDLAGRHFNRVRLDQLTDELQGELSVGDLQKAEAIINQYKRVELGVGAGVDPLRDMEAVQQAFADRQEPLVEYDGELKKFFGHAFERDGFVAFLGSSKRGKSFWLQDVAWRAMEQRRRVAFFEVGDMSQNQIMRRFMARAAHRPLKAELVRKPVAIKREGIGKPSIKYKSKYFSRGLSWRKAWKACERIVRISKTSRPLLRLSCHLNNSIPVSGIEGVLAGWEREDEQGWTADLIVIDYADILAPEDSRRDVRDQTNDTWRRLRALSQKMHCLVLTATQADARSYQSHLLRRQNFSEDRRKHDHVTGMIGISVEDEEKEKGLCRLNWIDLREGEFSETRVIYVVGCLALANPAMVSCF